VSILCYHSVEPDSRSVLAVSPELFDEQCAWLVRHRTILALPDALAGMNRAGRLPRGRVAVTFDDGFSGVLEHALPSLLRHRIPASVFLVAGTLAPGGQTVDWVEAEDLPAASFRTLTLEEARELKAAGIRFGSHSRAHRDLTLLDAAECERDLRESREILEDLLGERIGVVAYPRGRHDAGVRRAAARAGFSHGLALPERREPPGPYSIPRVGVYPGNGARAIRAKTSGWYLPVRLSPAFPAARRIADLASRRRGRRISPG
jgi:peptidoglycan/xylan/chitin deacetylase (PgdA/CDA1 family)